jgi:protease I
MQRCLLDKVLIIVGDAVETLDTLYPIYRLQEEGIQPVVAAPARGRYQMVMHEISPGWTITREWQGYTIEAQVAFSEVAPEEYLGIYFSGGRAPEYLRYDEDLVRITRHFFAESKPIACVCHGVEIPAYAGCVKGRRMATVPKCRFDLEVCGGIFQDAPCVIDDNLVSGRTYHDHGEFIGPWIKMLRAERETRAQALPAAAAAPHFITQRTHNGSSAKPS